MKKTILVWLVFMAFCHMAAGALPGPVDRPASSSFSEIDLLSFSDFSPSGTVATEYPDNICPESINSGVTIYSCNVVDYNLSENITNGVTSTFSWVASANNPSVEGESLTARSGNTLTDALTNTSNTDQVVVYTVTPTAISDGCEGDPFQVEVTVRPGIEVTGCFACNNTINVTLNEQCRVSLTLDEVAEGGNGQDCENYELLKEAVEVVVYDGIYPGGAPENADNVVDAMGEFSYEIRLRAGYENCFTWERCWGTVVAEDKSAPAVDCPDDVIGLVKTPAGIKPPEAVIDDIGYVFRPATGSDAGCPANAQCDDNCPEPVSGFNYLVCTDVDSIFQNPASYKDDSYPYFTGQPVITDCSAVELESVRDEKIELECGDEFRYGRQVEVKIQRTFTYRDEKGNRGNCTQTIWFFRPEIVLPPCKLELDLCDYPGINTGNAPELLKPESIGSIPYYFNGRCEKIYLTEHTCRLTLTFQDEPLAGPENCGVKLIRTWTFLDWCWTPDQTCEDFNVPEGCSEALSGWNNKTREYEQIIIVGDRGAPKITCPEMPVFSTGPFNCTAVINPPAPLVEDECSAWTWEFELYGSVTDPKTGITVPNQLIATSVDQLVSGIEPGSYDLHYLVRNECGTVTRHICSVEVADNIDPTAVCNEDLNISLGGAATTDDGIARVTVSDIDEGSRDNCEVLELEARREIEEECLVDYTDLVLNLSFPDDFELKTDPATGFTFYTIGKDTFFVEEGGVFYTWWAEILFFTCCDISEDSNDKVKLELRATDGSGNYNICWLEVNIEDKLPPSCETHDKEILCTDLDFDPEDPVAVAARFGTPEEAVDLFDNCGASISEELIWKPDNCGAGVLERVFTITDGGGLSSVCTQTITVETVNQYTIRFPGDKSSAECGIAPSDSLIYASQACDILAVSRDTARYDAKDDECFKLFVTYSILNWCEYDGESLEPTVIPRDIDDDDILEERTWLEAEEDADFVEKYLPGETETFLVKIYGANDNGNQYKLPERVLVRAACTDRDAFVGYRIWEKKLVGEKNVYVRICEKSISDLCADPDFKGQCWTPGFYQYTQILKVYDDTPPVVEVVSNDFDFCAYGMPGMGCDGKVDIAVTVTDNCTLTSTELRSVKLLLNGSPDEVVGPDEEVYEVIEIENTCLVTGNLPVGTHLYILEFADGCGNTVVKQIEFTVRDCKAPAPICINGVSIVLMPVDSDGDGVVDGGENTIWATDLIASGITDCSGEVTYSINFPEEEPDRDKTSITVNCDSPLYQTLPVEVHAWDPVGNHDFCETFIVIQDDRNLCEQSGSGSIAGLVITEEDRPVSDVKVRLSGKRSETLMTGNEGEFVFDDLQEGYDYSVTPSRDGDYLNGVSTFDLVLISKHILSVNPLDSPYKLIAADANRSGSVTTLDLIVLRKLILNIDMELRNNTSWRFVPAGYRFPNPRNPFGSEFPELLNANNLIGDLTRKDFIAIKIGDVNLSAKPDNLTDVEERGRRGTFLFSTADQELEAGRKYVVDLNTGQLDQVLGLQSTVALDPEFAELIELEYGVAGAEHFGLFPEEGFLTTSWFNSSAEKESQNGCGDPGSNCRFVSLVFQVKADCRLSKILSVNSRLTTAEAYDLEGELWDVALTFDATPENNAGFVLHQNYPNPFRNQTRISFELPEAGAAIIRIIDVTGREVELVKGEFEAGYNQLDVNAGSLSGPGVYFYTVQSGAYRASRAMILE